MPIEREFKYLLAADEDFESALCKKSTGIQLIHQGYLSKGGRIRSIQPLTRKGKPKGLPRFVFTYKHDLSTGGVLEIETPISASDFDLAWNDAAQRVFKTRYDLPFAEHVWEIDFLHDIGKNNRLTYLALAECEVDPAAGRPSALPPLIRDRVTYEVPENDSRFTNRKLSDRDYTDDLLARVLKP